MKTNKNIMLVGSNHWPWLALGISCLAMSLGCVQGRTSTHELEHVVPEHWPTGLADAADKIEKRLAGAGQGEFIDAQSHTQIADIISWLPEVAACTPLNEPTWDLVNEDCKQLVKRMENSKDASKVESDLRSLCARLRKLDGQLVAQ